MANIYDWSTTPSSNASASPNGWPEGMPPSGVNDSARQMMAETAKWRDLISGAKTTAGTDTITLTSGATITSYTGMMFVAKLGGTNTGAATINIDSVGAVAVEIDGAAVGAGDLVSGKYYTFVYDGVAFQASRLSGTSGSLVAADIGVTVQAYQAAQSQATWEAGVGTTESVVSPAKIAAAIAALALDQTARDMAASALAYTLAQNDATSITGSIGRFYLSDDFETDSLATKTNSTYDATGDYYANPGEESVVLGSSSKWAGTGLASFSFPSSTEINWISGSRNIRTADAYDTDFDFEVDLTTFVGTCVIGFFSAAEVGTHTGTNTVGGMTSMTVAYLQRDDGGSSQNIAYGATTKVNAYPVDGTTYKIERRSGVIKMYSNGVLKHTFAETFSGAGYFSVGTDSGMQLDNVTLTLNPGATPQNMTLAPTATTLDTADPTDLVAYVIIYPQEAITVGTDIVMTMSIDGGTTDATGTWTKVGDIGSGGEELYRVEADVSAQTGSSLTYEITTANTKEIQYHDCVGIVAIY